MALKRRLAFNCKCDIKNVRCLLKTKKLCFFKFRNDTKFECVLKTNKLYFPKKAKTLILGNRNEKIYIQVSDNISDEKTFERETSSLLRIKDAYPKILVSRTMHETYQYEGIQIYDVARGYQNKARPCSCLLF